MSKFYPNVLLLKYIQDDENNCCFSSSEYALYVSGEFVAEQAISVRIKEFFVFH